MCWIVISSIIQRLSQTVKRACHWKRASNENLPCRFVHGRRAAPALYAGYCKPLLPVRQRDRNKAERLRARLPLRREQIHREISRGGLSLRETVNPYSGPT